MTSNHSENPLERYEINKLVNEQTAFNISAPISEDEFEDSLQKLGSFLLSNTQWNNTVRGRQTLKNLPIVSDVVLLCKGALCEYHDLCPIMKGMNSEDKERIVGTACRAERIYGVTLFSDLVRDLSIDPDQTIDLIDAANVVRLMIYRRRLDWMMNIQGISIEGIVAVDPINGSPYTETKGHPLLKEIERIDKMISNARKNLVASRKDRIQLATQLGKGQNVLKSLFSKADTIDVEAETLPPPNEPSEE